MVARKKRHLDEKDILLMTMLLNGNPSVMEMAEAIQAESVGTISYRMKFLEQNDLITQPKRNQPRSRKLTVKALDILYDARIISRRDYERLRISGRAPGIAQTPGS